MIFVTLVPGIASNLSVSLAMASRIDQFSLRKACAVLKAYST
jgi:hypothetical protein